MRIVSLCPSTTETLVAFGLGDQLVGITRFCIHPADAVRSIPKVGGTKDPKRERIAALEPDLVFMNEEENRAEDHQWLSERFEVDVSLPRGPEEVPDLLRRWGRRLGREKEAEQWAEAIARRVIDLPPRRGEVRTPFLYLIWRNPWMATGTATYVDRLLEWGGGRNAIRDIGYPEVDLAQWATEPHLQVLLPDEPFPFVERHRAEVQALLPRSQVRLVNGDDCCWHGVRTLRGLNLVSQLFAS
jgi:ABC-type Fe3+-hydroxamate transport system substrate-binding protein